MKQNKFNFITFFTTWPNGLSLLEIFILIVGIAVGVFMYLRINQIRIDAMSASSFDKETSQVLVSVSMAYIHFDELMTDKTGVDLQKDVYAQLDTADSSCQNIDQGGPSGQFVPSSLNQNTPGSQPPSICAQLSELRKLIALRWQDHLEGNPDNYLSEYDDSFSQLLQGLQRFEGIADPHIQGAETDTRRVNMILSFSLTGIFCVIVLILWRTRISLTKKTKLLEKEIEVSSHLNNDLDSERNLLNTLLNAIPDAVFAKNRDNQFIIANSAAAHVMGITNKEDLVGKSEADFQPEGISANILADDMKIINTGEPIINNEEELFDLTTSHPYWRQTTKVPLRNRSGTVTGLVGISRDITKQKRTEEELQKTNTELIKGIAALEQGTRETECLSQMVDLLQASPSTEDACAVISDQMGKFFPDDSGILYLFHSSRNILDLAASWGPDLPDTLIFKPDDCWGLRRGKMHIIESKAVKIDQPGSAQSLICPHISPEGLADYLCVPLVAQGEALGLLHLRHKEENSSVGEQDKASEWYDQAKRQRLQSIIDSLSLSLANLKLRATLRQQSIRDPLTGMFNRRYMEETLEREVLRAARNKESVGVIMLDIDHFKQFNDTFGHQAGDVLLQSLGHFFLSHIRGEDVACRYGGEEFILLLPGSSIEGTRQRAEELREKIHFMNVTFQGQSLGTITLSLGVSVYPNHGATPETLVQTADQALYRAKSEGRDRVIIA